MAGILRARDVAVAIRHTISGSWTQAQLGEWAHQTVLDSGNRLVELERRYAPEIVHALHHLMSLAEGDEMLLDAEQLEAMATALDRQLLKVTAVETGTQAMCRSLQLIGDGLVLFTVSGRGRYLSGDIVHWRLADGRKSPLDIALDASGGGLAEVTFFASHEPIATSAQRLEPLIVREGRLVFDVSLWPDWQRGDRYFDTAGEAPLHLRGSDLVVAFDKSDLGSFVGSRDLAFFIGPDECVSALAWPRLRSDELGILQDAHLLEAE